MRIPEKEKEAAHLHYLSPNQIKPNYNLLNL